MACVRSTFCRGKAAWSAPRCLLEEIGSKAATRLRVARSSGSTRHRRAVTGRAIAGKTPLYAGGDGVGGDMTIVMTLLQTAKMNGIDPLAGSAVPVAGQSRRIARRLRCAWRLSIDSANPCRLEAGVQINARSHCRPPSPTILTVKSLASPFAERQSHIQDVCAGQFRCDRLNARSTGRSLTRPCANDYKWQQISPNQAMAAVNSFFLQVIKGAEMSRRERAGADAQQAGRKDAARLPGGSGLRLANMILDIIRDARFQPGHHLRELHFAEILGVSRTPVRMAFNILAANEIVISRKNKGFFLLKPYHELTQIEFETHTHKDKDLYSNLVRDRLAGCIPLSMTQSEIIERYGVDRASVLRTLSRLAEDGLVERNKARGWSFQSTLDTPAMLTSSYQFRLVIEPTVFLLPSFRADMSAIAKSRVQHVLLLSSPDISAIDSAKIFDIDAAFHELMAEFGGNAFILQNMQQQNRLRRLLEIGGYIDRRRIRFWCQEHIEILDALKASNYNLASQLMRDHLINSMNKTLRAAGH